MNRFLFSLALFGWTGLSAFALNVRDFGAKGDGVVDDAPAIQRALDAADAERAAGMRLLCNAHGFIGGYGVWDGPNPAVEIPRGRYRLSRPLVGVRGVTLAGEDGAELRADFADLPVVYLHQALRCTIRGLTFVGGTHHIVFWTKNQDTAMITIEGCRFENSVREAVVTEAFAVDPATTPTESERQKYRGPYDLTRDAQGHPVLVRTAWTALAPNSTRLVIRDCRFDDCGAAYRGSTDGQFFSRLTFRSSKVQELPVFRLGREVAFTDVDIAANLPDDYRFAWIELGHGNTMLMRVRAASRTSRGASLAALDIPARSECKNWSAVHGFIAESCSVDAAQSDSGSFIVCRRTEPAHLTVRNCSLSRGGRAQVVRFNRPPREERDLLEAASACKRVPLPPIALSHAILFSGNSADLDDTLPALLTRFRIPDLPDAIEARFPKGGQGLRRHGRTIGSVIDGTAFGLANAPSEGDTEKLAALFAAAARRERPVVRLPGRTYRISRPLRIPAAIALEADGRAMFDAGKESFPVLTASGDLNIRLEGILFNGGGTALSLNGCGTAEVRNCSFYDNRGLRIEREGTGSLRVDVGDTVVFAPVFLENRGGEVRIVDSWLEVQATLERASMLRNRSGTLLLENVVGVPVVFSRDRPGWKFGHDLFWIANAGVVRCRNMRFGGEFGGIPAVDNTGAGAVLIEGNSAHFAALDSCRALLRNQSAAATLVVRQVSSMFGITEGNVLCEGVLPGETRLAGFLIPSGRTVRPLAAVTGATAP